MAGGEGMLRPWGDFDDALIERIERSLRRCADRGFDYKQMAIVILAIIEDDQKKTGTPEGVPVSVAKKPDA